MKMVDNVHPSNWFWENIRISNHASKISRLLGFRCPMPDIFNDRADKPYLNIKQILTEMSKSNESKTTT